MTPVAQARQAIDRRLAQAATVRATCDLRDIGRAIWRGCHVQDEDVQSALRQSGAERRNILRTAFFGHLVPQDSNDGRAGVLLERIRTARLQKAAAPARHTCTAKASA